MNRHPLLAKTLAFAALVSAGALPGALTPVSEWRQTGPGELLEIAPERVGPLQLAVGKIAVGARLAKIGRQAAQGEAQLDNYRRKKAALGVIGPGAEKIYLVDGHHVSLALIRFGVPSLYVQILEDFRHLSAKQFGRALKQRGWVYLVDEEGRTQPFTRLPDGLLDLPDDRYRSLAWLVKKAGGFAEDKSRLFGEFAWAEFFRREVRLKKHPEPDDWVAAIAAGIMTARSKRARQLPGYLGIQESTLESCAEAIQRVAKYWQLPSSS